MNKIQNYNYEVLAPTHEYITVCFIIITILLYVRKFMKRVTTIILYSTVKRNANKHYVSGSAEINLVLIHPFTITEMGVLCNIYYLTVGLVFYLMLYWSFFSFVESASKQSQSLIPSHTSKMKLEIFTVDAFSSVPFSGNPAAIVPHTQVGCRRKSVQSQIYAYTVNF